MEEEEKIEWDLEELKQAYIRNAEEYDKLMKRRRMMNDYVGTALFLGIGIVVTYYQAKWYEYDPDKDF